MNVVGVDASTKSFGLALADGTLTTIAVKAGAKDPARRLDEIETRFVRELRMRPPLPDVVVIEAYADHSIGIRSTIALAELGGVIRLALYRLDVPYVTLQNSALKRYATGNGRAEKPAMIAAAQDLGATVRNDDEADAFLLRHVGLYVSGDVPRTGPLAKTRLEIASSITWPTKGRNL